MATTAHSVPGCAMDRRASERSPDQRRPAASHAGDRRLRSAERLRFADLVLDRTSGEAWRGCRPIALTRTERALLAAFLERPREVLTSSELYERVWGYDVGATSNALRVYVGYLRRKTEAGDEPRLLRTVRGVGYVLTD